MRKAIWLLFLAIAVPHAFGCGDKYVAFGRGVRFQRAYAAAHPGAILVYANARSPLAAAQNRERLIGLLRMVGHRPQAVSTPQELQAAIATGEFEVVLADPAEARQVQSATEMGASHPTLVQLLVDPTRDELKRIESETPCAVEVTKRNHDLLGVVDDVIDQRHKGGAVTCQRNRS